MTDNVNHPKHYTSHPSGVECITITEHMSFNVGNAVKYLWRADEKGAPIEDLLKAQWYVNREIAKRQDEAEVLRAYEAVAEAEARQKAHEASDNAVFVMGLGPGYCRTGKYCYCMHSTSPLNSCINFSGLPSS